jgi:hypothetical protein
MGAEFDWWLLIVGVVAGAGLTWLVLADSSRREQDVLDHEVPAEAGWLSRNLADEGFDVDPETAEVLLRAHRRYLSLPPPDALVDAETLERVEAPVDAETLERVEAPVDAPDEWSTHPPEPPDRNAATTPTPTHTKREGLI